MIKRGEMMKLAEKISELKQKEGELMRIYELRDSVAKQSFRDTLLTLEKSSHKKIEEKQKEFLEKKKQRIKDLTVQIQRLKEHIIQGRNNLNKKNVTIGVDKKLIEMKFLRLELSKLMNLIKKSSYSLEGIDLDIWDKLGINEQINELEQSKRRLDAEIQTVNWSNDL
jgi:hypothetical protein